jgi:hypothetical protein
MLYANGINDDTLALQELLDRGGIVTLDRPGTYLVSKTLIIRSNTRLVLSPGVILKAAPLSRCALIQNEHCAGGGRDHDIEIIGGCFDGSCAGEVLPQYDAQQHGKHAPPGTLRSGTGHAHAGRIGSAPLICHRRLTVLLCEDSFERTGQLVGAGRAAAALDALAELDDLGDRAVLGQTGDALGVAGAAADELDMLDDVAFDINQNLTGAGSLSGVAVHCCFPPVNMNLSYIIRCDGLSVKERGKKHRRICAYDNSTYRKEIDFMVYCIQ